MSVEEASFSASFSKIPVQYSNHATYEFPEVRFPFSEEVWKLKVVTSNYQPNVVYTVETSVEDVNFYVTGRCPQGCQAANNLKLTASAGIFTASINSHSCFFSYGSGFSIPSITIKCVPYSSPNFPLLKKTVEYISVEAPIPPPIKSLLSNVSSMLDNPEFSDFKFIVNEKEFNVHKGILAAASESFAKIFKVNKSFWKISDIDEEIFEHLLRFIYTGKAPENLRDIAVKMYEAADCFKIEELKEMSSKVIHSQLSSANSLETYNWAYIYDLELLKKKAWELVKRDVLKITFKMKDEPLKPDTIQKILDYQKKDKEFWDELKEVEKVEAAGE